MVMGREQRDYSRFSASLATLVAILTAMSTAASQIPPASQISDFLPPGARTTQLAVSKNLQHVYFVDTARALWVFDRQSHRSTRLVSTGVSDLAVAETGGAAVYVRTENQSAKHYLWTLPLDPRTGLASAPERRVNDVEGDTPAFSADGLFIAYAADSPDGVGQSLLVVPASGGRGRVVVGDQGFSLSAIRWSPDGSSIFFALNPPVACNPEWSCLPLPTKSTAGVESMRMVSVRDGAVSTVVPRIGDGWPGLSLDGTLIAHIDADVDSRLVVRDVMGRQRGAVSIQGRTVEGWLSATTLLLSDRGDVRRLKEFRIEDGTTRLFSETLGGLTEPAWSPNGNTISTVQCAPVDCTIRTSREDSSGTGAPTRTDQWVAANLWSRDGLYIAFVSDAGGLGRQASVIDVATGGTTRLGMHLSSAPSLLWAHDSRSIVLSTSGGQGPTRMMSFQRVGLGGAVQHLRDYVVGPSPNGGSAVDEHHAVILRAGAYRRVAFDGDSTDTVTLPGGPWHWVGDVAVSMARDRYAMRRTKDTTSTDANVIEVVDSSGTGRTTISVPFAVFSGASAIQFTPDGSGLIVAGAPWPEEPEVGIYLVSITDKQVRKLFAIPRLDYTGGMALSPDGRAVVFATNERTTPRVYSLDLSSLRR